MRPRRSAQKAAAIPPGKRSARRSRGERSCEFCRRRKLRCDQAQPQCENCKSRSIACEYAPRPQKPRPSNARIETLREENSVLKTRLQEQQSFGRHARIQDPPPASAFDGRRPEHYANHEHTSRPRDGVAAEEAEIHRKADELNASTDQFHGPTSAAFDAFPQNGQQRRTSAAIPDIYQKAQLSAEAARQRHLEQIYTRQGVFAFGHLTSQQGMALLTLFWNRQHATGCVVYRPSFMRDMATGGTYFSSLLLQAMLLYALRCSPDIVGFDTSPEGSYAAALPFRHEFDRLLASDGCQRLLTSSITTIQALLLMSDVLFAWLDERRIAWHYLSIAISMIMDLGIHTEQVGHSPEGLIQLESLEIRRRVFWAAFILDKIQTIYQGRPARLRDVDCNVPAVFMDEFEELEPFRTHGYSLTPGDTDSPTYSVSHLQHLCSLNVIADRILLEIYIPKAHQRHGGPLREAANLLQRQLDQWRESLPAHLSVQPVAPGGRYTEIGTSPLPHVLSLLSMFHALTILLHRPFIPEDHSVQTSDALSSVSTSICDRAAREIHALLCCYKSRFCMVTPPYFITYATYVSATIHIRTAVQKQSAGDPPYDPILTCVEILAGQSRRNLATQRMLEVLLELARRLGYDLGGDLSEGGTWQRRTSAQEVVPGSATLSINLSVVDGGKDLSQEIQLQDQDEATGIDSGDWSLMPELFFDVDLLFGFEAPGLELGGDSSSALDTMRLV